MNHRPLTVAPFGKAGPLLGVLCMLGIGSTRLLAQSSQSLSSSAFEGVYQSSVSDDGYGQVYNPSNTGAPISATYTQSFTGMDRSGNTQTMTFSGTTTASAAYGQLHADATGTVTNTYFNANNPAFIDLANGNNAAGSPDGFFSTGFADFADTLQYGGALQAGYQARYIFHLEGTNSGEGSNAGLIATIAGNTPELFVNSQTGNVSMDWATMDYAINGTSPQTINIQFDSDFSMHTSDFADGSTVSGEAAFSNTLTLADIEIVDANGNPVSGVTVTSASGTQYDLVPEPTTVAFLLLAGGVVLFTVRRRAKRASVWRSVVPS